MGGVLMDLENYSNRARPFFIRELLHAYLDEEHELTTNEIVGLLDALWDPDAADPHRIRCPAA